MAIKTLFVDVGGVLLTNGWDRNLRKKACQIFHLDFTAMESRHREVFDDFERGCISLTDYIGHIIFHQRGFDVEQFKNFIFSSVRPYREMIQLIAEYKKSASLKVILLSNEGAEIAKNRLDKFPEIVALADGYVVSGFVGYRKPDLRIYKLALSFVQTLPSEVFYVDDRESNLQPATNMGMHTFCHKDYAATRSKFEAMLF